MKHILTILLIGIGFNLLGQGFWKAEEVPVTTLRSDDAMYTPNRSFNVSLDFDIAKQELGNAVQAPFSSGKHITIDLPMPDGTFKTYLTYESPVMEQELADRYPSIKTFKGVSENGKSITRFGYGPSGFHATISTSKGEVNIDQVSKTGGQYYYSYYTADSGEPLDDILPCGTNHDDVRPLDKKIEKSFRNIDVELHTYRFAFACIGKWGRIRGTKEKALADMVVMVNRVNQIFEIEAGFRLVLINNNDRLIHLDPVFDGYNYTEVNGRVPGLELLGQNTNRINSLIGAGGYDIGHVISTGCSDVGGVAFLSSACSGNKGAGVTCSNANSTNALINTAQNTFAHELGHQFATPHMFNYCPIFENGQWVDNNVSLGNDFEPGSGTTIMSYAGACGLDNNVSNIRDPYYNNGSLIRMYNLTRNNNASCGNRASTDNIAPEVNIPIQDNFYIPASTYFVLTGEATDENDDNLTYCWEQHDAGGRNCQYGEPEGSCPLFRSLPPKDVPYRFFPNEQRIIGNSSNISEILPTYSRDMTFAFTVRDNNPDIGIAVWDYVEFKADGTAGPFRALTPSIGEEHEIGATLPVTWDVANTDNEIVNCQFVDIYLSSDKAMHPSDPNLMLIGGHVANTGFANIVLPPNVNPTTTGRILIRGYNSIFFDITDFNFTVKEASQPRAFFSMDRNFDDICLPGATSVNISTEGIAGYNGNINFEVIDLPSGVEASISNNDFAIGGETKVDFELSSSIKTGSYSWRIRSVSDDQDTIIRDFYINVISTDFSDLASVSPVEGLKDDAGLPVFTWEKTFNATEYLFELASNPSFEQSVIVYQQVTQDTFFKTPDFLDKSSVFYWRVKAYNECGEGNFTFTRSLGTVNLDCAEFSPIDTPINITSGSPIKIVSRANINSAGVISDLNLLKFQLNHDKFKDITATLKSPKGTEVVVFTNSCNNKYNSNCSFDDDSENFFNCANGVTIFKPKGTLADFNGENPMGIWELSINDGAPSNGGTLTDYKIEICGAIVTSPPFLVNNITLQIQPFNNPRITTGTLLTSDDDNPSEELIYTLVYNVNHGDLMQGTKRLEIGDKFTQEDIDNARMFYANTEEATNDAFYFTVEDGNGGWIEITKFNIEIDGSFTSSTNDPDLVNEVFIYPNPTKDAINVRLSNKVNSLNELQVMDIKGRLISKHVVSQGVQRIDLAGISDGVYLIKVTNGKDNIIKRFIIQN